MSKAEARLRKASLLRNRLTFFPAKSHSHSLSDILRIPLLNLYTFVYVHLYRQTFIRLYAYIFTQLMLQT